MHGKSVRAPVSLGVRKEKTRREPTMTPVIQALRAIFTQNEIRFIPDDEVKHWSGFSYYGLHKHSRCLYLTHVFAPETFLQVHIPKIIDSATVLKTYGVKGIWDPENANCKFSKTYLLRISLLNGLVNGTASVEDHMDFFVAMACQR